MVQGMPGWPSRPVRAPVCCSYWHYQGRRRAKKVTLISALDPRESSSTSPPIWLMCRVSKWISLTYSLVVFHTIVFFHCAPKWVSACGPLSDIPPYCRVPCQRWRSHWYHVSNFPTLFYTIPLLFIVHKLFNQPSVLLQEELLYI